MAVYDLCSESGKRYQVNIDLSDKYDVSDTAVFQTHYDLEEQLIIINYM